MIQLTDQPFDTGQLLTAFSTGRQETGAVVTFTGLARGESGQTDILELQAYPGFTEARIAEHAADATARFELHDVTIVHRVGRITPGEAIVFVATAAGHRRAAFEACDFLMDYLKSKAPFWKKEIGPSGERWVEPRAQDYTDIARWETPPK